MLAGAILVVAAAGLIVNVTGMWLLRAGPGASLNVKGAYLEVRRDALGALGVIVAALIVLTT